MKIFDIQHASKNSFYIKNSSYFNFPQNKINFNASTRLPPKYTKKNEMNKKTSTKIFSSSKKQIKSNGKLNFN